MLELEMHRERLGEGERVGDAGGVFDIVGRLLGIDVEDRHCGECLHEHAQAEGIVEIGRHLDEMAQMKGMPPIVVIEIGDSMA